MKTPNIDQFKAWARVNRPLAETVCLAQAFAEMERERVNAYILPIFQRYTFTADLHGDGHVLTDPDELYLSKDEPKVLAYYAETYKAHKLNGWKGREGHCPALTAEHDLAQAQNTLIDAASGLMGVELRRLTTGKRKTLLDTILGACLKDSTAKNVLEGVTI